MRKFINILAVAVCAAVVVSCGSKVNEIGVSKGNKSQMDTLSYAWGINFANDMRSGVPEMRFDWAVLADAAAESMLVEAAYEEDEANKKNLEVLESFFTTKRPERIQKFLEANPVDTTSQTSVMVQQQALIASLDIFETEEERKEVSAAYGYDLGARFRSVRFPIQAYWFAQAIKDFTSEKGAAIMSDEAANYVDTYFLNVMPRKNKEASEAWLAKVEKQKGVNKTESGLLYRIDREGDAVKPTGKDMVKCNYEGKLRDGFVFDSSYERGEPAEFPLSGVIPGWTEGLQLIGQGGQITLWIPSELAYGQGGAGGGMIGPNEALEFKVELIEVTPTEAPAVPATPIAE